MSGCLVVCCGCPLVVNFVILHSGNWLLQDIGQGKVLTSLPQDHARFINMRGHKQDIAQALVNLFCQFSCIADGTGLMDVAPSCQ